MLVSAVIVSAVLVLAVGALLVVVLRPTGGLRLALVVIAIGACACGGCMFKDSYNVDRPIGEDIPIDAYVAGCPPKPEAMIAATVKAIEYLKSA